MSAEKMSRRDWFRLRVSRENRTLGHDSSTDCQSGLKPIEHPPNHDGLDLNQLPPMREAVLSAEQVIALFADVGGFATDILLMQQSSATSKANASRLNSVDQLNLAKTALLSGEIKRVQIRYHWQNTHWIDTLKRDQNGFKLVRIAHDVMSAQNKLL